MTVSTQQRRVRHALDGVSTAFPVPFPFPAATDLVVTRTSAGGADTLLVLNVDYTVTGAGNPAGGTVTLTAAGAVGEKLTIKRVIARTQTTDYVPNDPFPAEAHEAALDKLTMMAQEDGDELARAVQVPDTDPRRGQMLLPTSTVRAGKFLGFDGAGLPVALTGTGADAGLRASLAEDTGAALVRHNGRTLAQIVSDLPPVPPDMPANGIDDDAPAIQALLDTGVKRILLPFPMQRIHSSLRLGMEQVIEGVGPRASTLMFRPTGADLVAVRNIRDDHPVFAGGGFWSGVERLRFNGADNDHYAVQFANSYSNILRDVYFEGVWRIGALFHDTYVCDIDRVDAQGCSFRHFIIAVSAASNKFTIRQVHSSGTPNVAGECLVGIAIEGGAAHSIIDPTLQGETIGIYLAGPSSTQILNPYFENTLCNIKTGDNTRPSESVGTTIIGGQISGPEASHPQYASRGPMIYAPRTGSLSMVTSAFQTAPNIAGANGPWPVLCTPTTGRVNLTVPRAYLGTVREIVCRTDALASPSLAITGSSYGSNGAQEIILKVDGAFAGKSAGLRIDSSGNVTADVFDPPIIGGTVSSLVNSAMPDIAGLVVA